MKKIKLYIDDIRQPPKGWTVVRTVREAMKFILKDFNPEYIPCEDVNREETNEK